MKIMGVAVSLVLVACLSVVAAAPAQALSAPSPSSNSTDPAAPGPTPTTAPAAAATNPPESPAGAAVEPAATASISGKLTGSGMAGATFTVEIYSRTSSYTATGDPDGRYTLSDLPADTFAGLRFSGHRTDGTTFDVNWGEDATHQYSDDYITLTDGEAKTGVDQVVYRLGSLSVQVNCDGCDQFPFQIGLAALDPASSTWTVLYNGATRNSDGSQSYSDLFPGTYRVSVSYIGAAGYDDPAAATMVLADGQSATQQFTLTRTGTAAPGVSGGVNAFVNALYADILNRKPSASEVTGWSQALSTSNNRGIVAEGFVDSDEYRLIRIDNAYRTILGRNPEPGGPEGWLDGMHRGLYATDDVEKNFLESDEFFNKTNNDYPAWTAFYYWVSSVYTNVLGRSASESEMFFWANNAQMRANETIPDGYLLTHPDYRPPLDRAWVVNQIYDSLEAASARVTTMYLHYLGRTPDANGVLAWAQLDIANGDASVRSGVTASEEYYNRASMRYPAQ